MPARCLWESIYVRPLFKTIIFSQVHLSPEFAEAAVEACDKAVELLGVAEDVQVEARLYKLVLYEPGKLKLKPHLTQSLSFLIH